MGRCQVFALGNLTHLFLHHVPNGEEGLLQLPVVNLRKEVGLVLDGVGTGAEPLKNLGRTEFVQHTLFLCLGVVACGYEVVVVAALLVEGTELDEPVAHDVGVGGQSCAYLVHRVLGHLVPVLAVTVNNLQPTAVLVADGSGHLQVLLGGTVPFLFLLRAYLDVEAVGLQPLAHQFVERHGRVDAAR